MSPEDQIPTVSDPDAWKDLEDVDANGVGLTEFEIEFLENIRRRMKVGHKLSKKQRTKLRQICDERLVD